MNVRPLSTYDPSDTFSHLSRSPIVETVLEIQVQAQFDLQVDAVSTFKDSLPDYPHVESGTVVTNQLSIEPTGLKTDTDSGLQGYRLAAADGLQVVAFEQDAFRFHRLEPYLGWDAFSRESLRLWNIYKTLGNPVKINRIGIRAVNRIDLPSQSVRTEDYFTNAPECPGDLELALVGFLHRDAFMTGDGMVAKLTRTMTNPDDRSPAFILDIDVSTGSPVIMDDNGLLKTMARLRWLKNKVFFGSLKNEVLKDLR